MRLRFGLILLMCVVYSMRLSGQCVMCKEAAEAETRAVGINEGILYLMAAPYLVMGAALLGYFCIGGENGRAKACLGCTMAVYEFGI